ncbi:PREDICTED: uncharacterized protein LOC105564891 [Vollenhovia emeryi]|uniref:uncharacterized protein LOC105564891 n=1 Tax=Vollenhovia emeryi TaxID=411798 RepID=UPI0005F48EE5|nr:PREDICTED: uncharacterized protein LOC105564891 [Vollenhovia emeryi]
MPIDCYYFPPSPPCRTIILLAKALGIHLNFKLVNMASGEHLTPEYLKINPQHTVPAIDDNGFILCESRPILAYLVSKYARNDSLYPKDPKERAVVDQMMYFDCSLFSTYFKCYMPVIGGLANSVNEADLARVEKSFEVLNALLDGKEFVAGDNLTIADFTISTTICTALCCDFDIGRYDNVAAYYDRCKENLERFGFEEVHAMGVKAFTEMYHANLQESSLLRTLDAQSISLLRACNTQAVPCYAVFINSSHKQAAYTVCHNLATPPESTICRFDFKMPIDLYQVAGSAPCRAVRLAAAAIGVDLNLKNTDLMGGEHLKPEFVKMNPQHTVPTLDDNGLYLWESRAIMTYLANQYSKNDCLYPKDPKKRALVDQRMYFDMGTLYQSFADYYYTLIFSGVTPEQAKLDKINNALCFLDKFLEGENYVAGKTLTLADLTLVVTISNFKLVDHDLSKYKNILRWFPKIQAEAPKYAEIETPSMKAFKDFVDNLRKKKLTNCLKPSMPLQLYYFPPSPPCRAVMLVAEAIGLEVELIVLNVMAGENLTPEYEELNPQKTIPFLIDDDLKLSESRAIMSYLVDQYGPDDTLYPRNPQARALINQRLYFDLGTLFMSVYGYYMTVFRKEVDTYDPAQYRRLTDAFKSLNNFLEGQDYVTGDNLTIADLALVVSVTQAEVFGFDLGEYENVSNWLKRVQESTPGYEKANGEPLEMLRQFIQASQGNEGEGEEGGGEGGEEGQGGEEGEGGEEENE